MRTQQRTKARPEQLVHPALTELFQQVKNGKTPVVVERIVTDIDEIAQRFIAASLSLLLFACSATGYVPPGPSGSTDLSRYVLVIQEGPNGQVSHSWQPLSGFDVSRFPRHASNSRFEGELVRASFNRDCEAERDECEEMCRASLKGRNWTHVSKGSKNEICIRRCMPAYQDCCERRELVEAGKLRLSFPVVDSAVDWLKQHHRELVVGTVVVIAGVAFVVVVAGSGGSALVLAPAVLLVSAGVPSAPPFTGVEQ